MGNEITGIYAKKLAWLKLVSRHSAHEHPVLLLLLAKVINFQWEWSMLRGNMA
jgi:hypothetical protein